MIGQIAVQMWVVSKMAPQTLIQVILKQLNAGKQTIPYYTVAMTLLCAPVLTKRLCCAKHCPGKLWYTLSFFAHNIHKASKVSRLSCC